MLSIIIEMFVQFSDKVQILEAFDGQMASYEYLVRAGWTPDGKL